jgi:hypothetical protein
MFLVTSPPAWADDDVETIVLLRHGEKPEGGLGQLNCQGLNRALALPQVITKEFGRPDFIFAPDPSDQKKDDGEFYDYVRPLATIEPTAIKFGLPVDASIGVSRTDRLEAALEKRKYRNALVVVAWEHNDIVTIARDLLSANGGDTTRVPDAWPGDDNYPDRKKHKSILRAETRKPGRTADRLSVTKRNCTDRDRGL